ncbi:MAG TPA: FHA domain-containing protein [Trebonia sp.]|nr:FHA domain-containing protein [Trebonia sp.]
MATCPSGHESASDDFCDVCGVLIGAPPSIGIGIGMAPDAGASAGTEASAAGGAPRAEPCPRCGAPRVGLFCEACGYDFTAVPPTTFLPVTPASLSPTSMMPAPVTPAPPAPAPAAPAVGAWVAVVTADRAYYDSVQAGGGPDAGALSFPAYCPERRFPLSGAEVRVGRRSVSRGIDPEIDLTGPPADPGVSRLHMVLVEATDGTWSVVDPGSENGTLVNGSEIRHGEAVPLHDGDRIHLGAWTALTITRGG